MNTWLLLALLIIEYLFQENLETWAQQSIAKPHFETWTTEQSGWSRAVDSGQWTVNR